jgi:OOP family OmpA-OmpF porin
VVQNNGNGNGTANGLTVKMDPLPKMAPLGRFPKLQKLGPVGRPCGTLIRISAGVLFDFDKAALRPEAGPVLTAVAALTNDGFSGPLHAQGFGETQPVAPNTLKGKDNPAGRQLNRRVEIVIPG